MSQFCELACKYTIGYLGPEIGRFYFSMHKYLDKFKAVLEQGYN